MSFTFEIPGRLPSLNDFLREGRRNRYGGNRIKQTTESRIIASIPEDRPQFDEPVVVLFTWIREDMRTDKDNVAFAKKFVLDALQKAGVLRKDSWMLCTPYDSAFLINKTEPRTVVEILTEDEWQTRQSPIRAMSVLR